VRPPATRAERELATLVGTLPVRPIIPEPPPPAEGAPAPPPIPVPPGVDRGATAVVRESLSAEALTPMEYPVDPGTPVSPPLAAQESPLAGPLVAPTSAEAPRRHYFVVGVSPRGRSSVPSTPVSVALAGGASAPGPPTVTYTETTMTLTWQPSPDARTSTFLTPPPVATNASAPVRAPLPPLTARSLGFTSEPTLYHVFDATTAANEDPMALVVPKPLTAQALALTTHTLTGVTFGQERCFIVRPVDQIAGVPILGPASPRTCETPVDTFPPAPPRSLAAIAGAGVVNLIWDPSAERDLAGYLVLRADAPSGTLRPLTAEPVATTTYRDEAVTPGARYTYVVVAVDRAGNRSVESNRVDETARQ
jgi:hypothetical protein